MRTTRLLDRAEMAESVRCFHLILKKQILAHSEGGKDCKEHTEQSSPTHLGVFESAQPEATLQDSAQQGGEWGKPSQARKSHD